MTEVEDLDRETLGRSAGNDERVKALVQIARASKEWSGPKGAIDFGAGVKWLPHLVRAKSAGPKGLLHVVLADVLQPYLVDRLKAAQAAGWELHLVVDYGSLHAAEFVERLVGLDVTVYVTQDDGKFAEGESLLVALGRRGVALPRKTAEALASTAWKRLKEGDAHARGRRLEGLLAFQFGQVSGLRILETNLRTATEEIDVALQVDRDVGASWYESGVPFLLVESKNWTSTVGSKEISAFLVKVQFKRDRCRIGIICAAGGFTEDAKNHELRLAATKYTIAMMGPKDLEAWIAASDPTKWLDGFVARAMLR